MPRSSSALALFARETFAPKNPPKQTPCPSQRNAEGRRAVAEGKRPPILQAIMIVMGGTKVGMGSLDVAIALEQRGWLPNAANPKEYINWLMGSNPRLFERVNRGVYIVRPKG